MGKHSSCLGIHLMYVCCYQGCSGTGGLIVIDIKIEEKEQKARGHRAK